MQPIPQIPLPPDTLTPLDTLPLDSLPPEGTWDQRYPTPHPRKDMGQGTKKGPLTDTCGNITFPQPLLRTVMTEVSNLVK